MQGAATSTYVSCGLFSLSKDEGHAQAQADLKQASVHTTLSGLINCRNTKAKCRVFSLASMRNQLTPLDGSIGNERWPQDMA